MTDEEKLAHLNRLCSIEKWRIDLLAPFRVEGKHVWSCATDGKWMFAWRGELVASDKLPVTKRDAATKWLRDAAGADVAVPMTKLREFCGPPSYPKMAPCSSCGGDGNDEDGDTCFDCDGDKIIAYEDPPRHGQFFGTPFNLWRVAALLDGLEDETVWIRVVPSETLMEQQLQMHGADWIALLMPMQLHDEEIEAAPAFSANE